MSEDTEISQEAARALLRAAEQFVAIAGDGNLTELTEYLVDIFSEAIAEAGGEA